jgi:mannose/fructose-specific phosphotransferase system component IIA
MKAARGLIVTHGRLGDELIAAATLILGHADGLTARTNTGLSTSALRDQVSAFLAEDSESPVVLLVDLLGGSCAQAGAALVDPSRVRLVTGVNLAMVIAFLQGREREPLDELVSGILARAHRGIQAFPALAEGSRT